MFELPILYGCCTIQLYRKVSGSNAWPHTIKWEICGNTLVDEGSFYKFNQYRWLMVWNDRAKYYIVNRSERDANGVRENVVLAREILGLPRNVGPGTAYHADHYNHDTLDNTLDNLRVANRLQSLANRRSYSTSRFKGYVRNGNGYTVTLEWNGIRATYPTLKKEIEVALIYNYAADLIYGEFANLNIIPEDEMPTLERQWELYDMVIAKLREKKVQFDESRVMQR